MTVDSNVLILDNNKIVFLLVTFQHYIYSVDSVDVVGGTVAELRAPPRRSTSCQTPPLLRQQSGGGL